MWAKIKSEVLTLFVLMCMVVLSFYSFNYINDSNKQPSGQIPIGDVLIAYTPENGNILFLDKKTNELKFILSDTIATMIFVIKSKEINFDYNNGLLNKQK